jgi:cation transport regulator ChaB
MNSKRIVIDGKAYNSVDEMPEEVRRQYQEAMRDFKEVNPSANPPQNIAGTLSNIFTDANNNGMPDIMENQHAINVSGAMNYVVDGQAYNSIDQLPPEIRAQYEQAMGAIDKNRNGIPDFLEGMMNMQTQAAPAQPTFDYPADTTRHASRPPQPVSPSIAPDTSNGWMLALALLGLLFLCAAGAAGVWYFLIR